MNSLKPQDIGSGLCEKCGRNAQNGIKPPSQLKLLQTLRCILQNNNMEREFIASLKRPEQ